MRSVVTHLPSASPRSRGGHGYRPLFEPYRAAGRAALFDGDGIFLARGVYYIHVPAVVHAGEAFVIQGFDICRFAVPRRRRRVVRLRGEACGVRQHKRSQYSE